jgi:small subunit ribosomal protein S20
LPAKKAARQSLKRFQRNRSVRSATRTGVAKALRTLGSGNLGEAETTVTQAASLLDRAVRKGVLHKNTASRGKSRLSARLNRLRENSAS